MTNTHGTNPIPYGTFYIKYTTHLRHAFVG